jgi:hypothetical protein
MISERLHNIPLFIYGTTFKKNESDQDFQRGQIWNDRSQKQKLNYGRHPRPSPLSSSSPSSSTLSPVARHTIAIVVIVVVVVTRRHRRRRFL